MSFSILVHLFTIAFENNVIGLKFLEICSLSFRPLVRPRCLFKITYLKEHKEVTALEIFYIRIK